MLVRMAEWIRTQSLFRSAIKSITEVLLTHEVRLSANGCYGFRNYFGAKEDWKHMCKTDLLRAIKSTNHIRLWKSPNLKTVKSWEST